MAIENLFGQGLNPFKTAPQAGIDTDTGKVGFYTVENPALSTASKDSDKNSVNFWDGLATALESYSTSAMKAEAAAAETQKKDQQDLMDYAADINKKAADLAWDREQTSADKQMKFQTSEREAAQTWEKEMSDTAYQRAVEDLKSAGLNPALAITNLSAASTPSSSGGSGAFASASAPTVSSGSAQKASAAAGKQADLAFLSVLVRGVSDVISSGLTSVGKIAKILLK